MQTCCPRGGPGPRGRKTAGSVQPPGCGGCSRSPLPPTVPSLLQVCLELPRVLSAPSMATQSHTCSPCRAPSPSPAATPYDSGDRRDHRAPAGAVPRAAASAQPGLLRRAGSGATPGLPGRGLSGGGAWWGGADRGAGLSSHLVAGQRQPGARRAPHPLGHAPESAKRLRSSPGSDPPALGSRPWPVHGRGARVEHQRPPRSKGRLGPRVRSAALAGQEG